MIAEARVPKGGSIAHLRVRVSVLEPHRNEPIFARLATDYQLAVNVINTSLEANGRLKQLDLELAGTIAHMQSGLAYLESLNLPIRGKPNPAGDSWHY